MFFFVLFYIYVVPLAMYCAIKMLLNHWRRSILLNAYFNICCNCCNDMQPITIPPLVYFPSLLQLPPLLPFPNYLPFPPLLPVPPHLPVSPSTSAAAVDIPANISVRGDIAVSPCFNISEIDNSFIILVCAASTVANV